MRYITSKQSQGWLGSCSALDSGRLVGSVAVFIKWSLTLYSFFSWSHPPILSNAHRFLIISCHPSLTLHSRSSSTRLVFLSIMIVCRSVCLSVAALLFGTALAAPTPYNPAHGEIVNIAPVHTNGGTAIGVTRSSQSPSHIALGSDQHGNVILAPVTHSNNPGLGPSMSANGMHNLHGNVLLNHVTAHPNNIAPGPGHHAGANVGAANVHAIQQAQHQVDAQAQAHHAASQAHTQAAQSHTDAQTAHTNVAFAHTQHGNHVAAQDHHNQAAIHGQHAVAHTQQAAHHTQAAHSVAGVNHADHAHALQSAANAHASHNSAVASHEHASAGHAHLSAAHAHDSASRSHNNAAHAAANAHMHPQIVNGHVTAANNHAATAQGHRATATAHAPSVQNKPNAAQSHHQATVSRHQANQSKATVPHHLQHHRR
ncbi:hypothetical protein BDZ97DRAFT_1852535 [Flammula alnicola]|nr:hypothetical protein BDZ97DRAFT_1852535 [Flammula alnicola]